MFRVEREGEGEVKVGLPGGPAIVRTIVSALPARRSLAPAMQDDWTHALDARWRSFGDPQPLVIMGAGPDRGPALFTNGDQSFQSGVVSRGVFDLSHGLTAEVLIKTSFTGAPFQDWRIAFVSPDSVPGPIPATWEVPGPARGGLNGEEGRVAGDLSDISLDVPLPDRAHEWRRYALQLSAVGELALLVDGQVHFRGQADMSGLQGEARVVISGNSLGTRILHGHVAVYEGELYRIR